MDCPAENLRDRDANQARHWEPARAGVADITWGNFTHEPERFVSTGFSEFPNAGTDAEAQSVALWRICEAQLANLPDVPGARIVRGLLPFVGVDLVRLGLLPAFPVITPWLDTTVA